MAQPLCRFCGCKIRKLTATAYFGKRDSNLSQLWREYSNRPRSKEEIAKLTNLRVMHVRWTKEGQFATERAGHLFIERATLWDGESYIDDFFCSDKHAKAFGYLLAEKGHATMAWQVATEAAMKNRMEDKDGSARTKDA